MCAGGTQSFHESRCAGFHYPQDDGQATQEIRLCRKKPLHRAHLWGQRNWSENNQDREFMEPSKKESFHGKLRFRFVRGLAIRSAVTSLLFLVSCPSAFAGGQHGFSIKVFTSTDDQFWTNSVIIEGEHDVMLVDAQLTKTNAERVLEEIKETKKPLSIVYITHEHADHFLGLEVFKEAYPRI